MNLILRATLIERSSDIDPSVRWMGDLLEVTKPGTVDDSPRWKACEPAYRMMCDAITADTESAEGSGAAQLENIRRIETGFTDYIWGSGNAWVTHITRDKVWFEGLYDQGDGGEVSLAQYRLAMQTYVKFLADPQHKTIEVEFPDH